MAPPAPKTAFTGRWLVSEYVYTPSGAFAGIVRQERSVIPRNGHLRVRQFCRPVEPPPDLSPEAGAVVDVMNRRTGEYIFDLAVEGQARHYLGPDVLGGGYAWKEGVLTARGMWPGFGCNFSSFSIQTDPHRQVTGGRFFHASREICTIIGLAAPETAGYPEFTSAEEPEENWSGDQFEISPSGEVLARESVTWAQVQARQADVEGCTQAYGPLKELAGTGPDGQVHSWMHVVDTQNKTVAGMQKTIQNEALRRVSVFILRRPS